ncbi:hypothetical protein Trydic_g6434 [Trypoxylus dichotomus]
MKIVLIVFLATAFTDAYPRVSRQPYRSYLNSPLTVIQPYQLVSRVWKPQRLQLYTQNEYATDVYGLAQNAPDLPQYHYNSYRQIHPNIINDFYGIYSPDGLVYERARTDKNGQYVVGEDDEDESGGEPVHVQYHVSRFQTQENPHPHSKGLLSEQQNTLRHIALPAGTGAVVYKPSSKRRDRPRAKARQGGSLGPYPAYPKRTPVLYSSDYDDYNRLEKYVNTLYDDRFERLCRFECSYYPISGVREAPAIELELVDVDPSKNLFIGPKPRNNKGYLIYPVEYPHHYKPFIVDRLSYSGEARYNVPPPWEFGYVQN